MKKYLLILIVAIFCLPSEGFAQFYTTIFGDEAERQRSISMPFHFNDHRTEKKQKNQERQRTRLQKRALLLK